MQPKPRHATGRGHALRVAMRRMLLASGLVAAFGLAIDRWLMPLDSAPMRLAHQLHRQLPIMLGDGIKRVAVRPAGERAFILHYQLAPSAPLAANADQFVQAWQPRLDRDFCESPLFAPLRARRSSVSFVFMHSGSPRPYAVVTSMLPWCPKGPSETATQ